MKNTKYYDLEQILPHNYPMILVTRVLEYDLQTRNVLTAIEITASSPFFDISLGGVPVWVGIEYMAQSVGTLCGIYNNEMGLGKPPIAFLLGARSYDISIPKFKAGETYTVQINENFTDSELGSYSCKIFAGDTICMVSDINTFKPNDPEMILQGLL